MDTAKARAERNMPGLKKSLNRNPPGSRIIEFAGIARGVQTATDDAQGEATVTGDVHGDLLDGDFAEA